MPDRRSNRAPTVTIIESGEDRLLIDESELRRRLEVERALAYADGYRDGFAAGRGDELEDEHAA